MNSKLCLSALAIALLLAVGPDRAHAGDTGTIEAEKEKVGFVFDIFSFWPFRHLCVGGCDKAKVIHEEAQDTFSTDTQMEALGMDPNSPEADQVRQMLGR
jgi:hypothetical protein